MDPLIAAAALAGLVAVSAGIGVVWRARDGRVNVVSDTAAADIFTPSHLPGVESFADRATLVLFSTELCSRCPPTERMLRQVASQHSGVDVTVVDLTSRPDLASRFRVLQTPTVLVIDGNGRQVARSVGAPQRAAIDTLLTTLTPRSSHVAH
jgi:thioredoxin-like negative regulator of GroEL